MSERERENVLSGKQRKERENERDIVNEKEKRKREVER